MKRITSASHRIPFREYVEKKVSRKRNEPCEKHPSLKYITNTNCMVSMNSKGLLPSLNLGMCIDIFSVGTYVSKNYCSSLKGERCAMFETFLLSPFTLTRWHGWSHGLWCPCPLWYTEKP